MFTAKSTLIDNDIYLCNKKFTVYTVQIFPVITI